MAQSTIKVDPGTTTDTRTVTDVAGVHVPASVVAFQNTSTEAQVVTEANPLPVTVRNYGTNVAVIGNVTVVQPTGTNLHTVVDNGTLAAIVGNVTVVQPTGTSLHTVIDSGTLTAVVGTVTAVLSPETTKVIGTINISASQPISPIPITTGGWTVALFTSSDGSTALTATAQVVKASAGKFGGYYIYNPNTAATYVHLYNVAAASVTVGTTAPMMTFCIPASAGANLELVMGVPFSNAGWSIAATTTGGGNSAPSTALEAMIFYI